MFEFYFQSGEFLSEDGSFFLDLFIEIAGAFVGAGTALYLYNREVKQTKIEEQDKKKEFELQKVKYLQYLVKKAIEYSKECYEGLFQFSSDLAKDPFTIPKFPITLSEHELKIIVNSLNQEDYYFACRNVIVDSKVHEVFNTCSVIEGNVKSMKEYIRKLEQFDYNRKTTYKDLLQEVDDELYRVVKELNHMNNDPQYNVQWRNEIYNAFTYFKKIYNDYGTAMASNPKDLIQFRKLIFEPILQFTLVNNQRFGFQFDFLIAKTRNANGALTQISLHNSFKAKEIEEFAKSIQETTDQMIELSKPLIDKDLESC